MELVNLQAVPSYYISEILKDKVKTNADEIKKFYDKYSATRLLRGKPFNDKTKQYIKSRLIRRKFEMESQRFVLQLKEESKINSEGFRKHLKESAKIKKDSSSKKKDSKSDKKDSMKTKKK